MVVDTTIADVNLPHWLQPVLDQDPTTNPVIAGLLDSRCYTGASLTPEQRTSNNRRAAILRLWNRLHEKQPTEWHLDPMFETYTAFVYDEKTQQYKPELREIYADIFLPDGYPTHQKDWQLPIFDPSSVF